MVPRGQILICCGYKTVLIYLFTLLHTSVYFRQYCPGNNPQCPNKYSCKRYVVPWELGLLFNTDVD